MPLIWCETIRTKENEFELSHTYYMGNHAYHEEVTEWEQADNDRLRAAIICVGMACRALSEMEADIAFRIVGIESDIDGKDKRYDGEHDILYSLLCPTNEYEHSKNRSLYGEYDKYLGRINDLRWEFGIRINLQQNGEMVRYN